MAYAIMILEKDSFLIESWEMVDILSDESINVNDSTTDVLITKSAKLLRELVLKWSLRKPDIAYLENQPLGQMARNVKTKTLSHVMQALLISYDIPVQFVSPKKKLQGMEGVGSYSDNKKFAVAATVKLLENEKSDWLSWFQEVSGKKDDLADALLQGFHAGKSSIIAKQPKVKKSRTKRKRDSHADASAVVFKDVEDSLS